MNRCYLFLATAAALLAAPPAKACSVAEGTRAMSSFQMARAADVIFVGIVEYAPLVTDENFEETHLIPMTVRPIEILKGGPLPERVRVPGALASGESRVRSDPNELSEPHPEAGMGPCNRVSFLPNSRVLFFLDREGERLEPAGHLYNRWAEDVPRRNSRWVATVRNLIEVASLPEADWRSALLQRSGALASLRDDPAARAVAEELLRQLQFLDDPGWIRPPN